MSFFTKQQFVLFEDCFLNERLYFLFNIYIHFDITIKYVQIFPYYIIHMIRVHFITDIIVYLNYIVGFFVFKNIYFCYEINGETKQTKKLNLNMDTQSNIIYMRKF